MVDARQPSPAKPLPAKALAALREARRLDAVAAVREAEGLGLAAAAKRVDEHLAADPSLRKRLDERQRERTKRLIGWVLVVDAIVVAAALAWWFSR